VNYITHTHTNYIIPIRQTDYRAIVKLTRPPAFPRCNTLIYIGWGRYTDSLRRPNRVNWTRRLHMHTHTHTTCCDVYIYILRNNNNIIVSVVYFLLFRRTKNQITGYTAAARHIRTRIYLHLICRGALRERERERERDRFVYYVINILYTSCVQVVLFNIIINIIIYFIHSFGIYIRIWRWWLEFGRYYTLVRSVYIYAVEFPKKMRSYNMCTHTPREFDARLYHYYIVRIYMCVCGWIVESKTAVLSTYIIDRAKSSIPHH